MQCPNCESHRVLQFVAKCNDAFFFKIGNGPQQSGYVPRDLGIGGGDFVRMTVCLDCGVQPQVNFPVDVSQYEEENSIEG